MLETYQKYITLIMTTSFLSLVVSLNLLGLSSAFVIPMTTTTTPHEIRSPNALNMVVRNRGLEVRRDGATPQEGGMTLYIKAGSDGTSAGDCPFAHYIRMVLHEKNLDYDLKPTTQETKPTWLIQHYEGKLPALRHRKECYTESEVIAQYLDFFFPKPELTIADRGLSENANQAVEGFFPAVAKYLKHTPDGNDQDNDLKAGVKTCLETLETHLAHQHRTGHFLVGDGETFTLLDCSLAPKLYHLTIGLKAFKNNAIQLESSFPFINKYMQHVFERQSFVDTTYPEETVVSGWEKARK